MIKTVVREHHWTPDRVDQLYVDEVDHHGIEFWYNDIKEVHNKLKDK
jgi:hypothetical protein